MAPREASDGEHEQEPLIGRDLTKIIIGVMATVMIGVVGALFSYVEKVAKIEERQRAMTEQDVMVNARLTAIESTMTAILIELRSHNSSPNGVRER